MVDGHTICDPGGVHKRPCDMRTKLDADAERDDEIDETDGVEADTPGGRDAHDGDNGECDDTSDDRTCAPGAEHEGSYQQYGREPQAKYFLSDGDDVRILVKVDVEERVWENVCPGSLGQIVRDTMGGGEGVDKVILRLQRRVIRSEMRGQYLRVIIINGQRIAKGRPASQRTLLSCGRHEPLVQVSHKFAVFRESVHSDVPGWFPALKARSASPGAVPCATELGGIALLHSAALLLRRIQPCKEIVNPGRGRFSDEG
jgi:hypothetical protein